MTEINVQCDIINNTLRFKCPFCKNLTKKGTVRKGLVQKVRLNKNQE